MNKKAGRMNGVRMVKVRMIRKGEGI